MELLPRILGDMEPGRVRDLLGYLNSRAQRANTSLSFNTLRGACLYQLGNFEEAAQLLLAHPYSENPWAQEMEAWSRALLLLSQWRAFSSSQGDDLARHLGAFLFDAPFEESRRWVYRELGSLEGLLGPMERLYLTTRFSPGNNRLILSSLIPALFDGGTILLRYPDLISDLGRAIQANPSQWEEGLHLFRSWVSLLESSPSQNLVFDLPPSYGDFHEEENFEDLFTFVRALDQAERDLRLYLLLFFVGRIERARGNFLVSSDYFYRALDLAPDPIQSDACIWYLLMNAINRDPLLAIPVALETMHRWDDMSAYTAILDRLSSHLVSHRRWADLLPLFMGLEQKGSSASRAQYAWILGRAVEEGHLRGGRRAEDYFRIALEEEGGSFYYRTMAALSLGENFVPYPAGGEEPPVPEVQDSEAPMEAEFLLGFFESGASALALPYYRPRESLLPIGELRRIAEALSGEERWQEKLSFISRYTRRDDYQWQREDLLLLYPRPFLDLIEGHAETVHISPEVFFALIRTESFFNDGATSRVGAMGLTQLMTATAEDMAGRMFRQGLGDYRSPDVDFRDPEINIHVGAFYLRYLYDLMENPMLALLAYNGGLGRVRRWTAEDRNRGALPLDLFLETIEFPETRDYGRLVLGAAAVYGYLYYDTPMEETALAIFEFPLP